MAIEQVEVSECRSWREAALWMLFLGPFFFLVWSLCNWITSLRPDIGTFYFEWEKLIPFIPWMIIPYVSLDFFFAGSAFLCRTRAELHTLVKRIIFTILISATAFLLFPLRFGFERPQTSPTFDRSFDLLAFLIGDFNLFPSLHISLRWILWDVYRRHTSGLVRIALCGWFFLIALSTVLGYQHHIIDVVGDEIVAVLSFYFFREVDRSARSAKPVKALERAGTKRALGPKNLKAASTYGLLSLSFLMMTYTAWPWSFVLAWPAVALAIMASAYLGLGTEVFRKSRGRLPFSTLALLAPYLLGVYLSSLYYRRLSLPHCEVVPGLVMGRKLNREESEEAIREGVSAVLDLSAEYSEADPFLHLPYKNVQILDLTVPAVEQLDDAVEFIREHSGNGKVYVHCALGYSRSAIAVAAYLIAGGGAKTVEEAIRTLRKVRPEIVLKADWLPVIHAYQARRRQLAKVEAKESFGLLSIVTT